MPRKGTVLLDRFVLTKTVAHGLNHRRITALEKLVGTLEEQLKTKADKDEKKTEEKHRQVVVMEPARQNNISQNNKVLASAVLPNKPGARFLVRFSAEVQGRSAWTQNCGGGSMNHFYFLLRYGGSQISYQAHYYIVQCQPVSWTKVVTVQAGQGDQKRTVDVLSGSSVSSYKIDVYDGVLEIIEL